MDDKGKVIEELGAQAQDIPIEVLQNGLVINEKEVKTHQYMIVEVILYFKYFRKLKEIY